MGAGPFSGDPFLVSGNVQEAARVPEGRMPPLDDSDSEEEHDLDQEQSHTGGNSVFLGRVIHGVCWVLQEGCAYRGTSLIRNSPPL